jgi:hypothetical protein
VIGKAKALAGGVCSALTAATGTATTPAAAVAATGDATLVELASWSNRKKLAVRFSPVFSKLSSLDDFVAKLKAAIEQAKQDLIKVKAEALGKAAVIVAKSVSTVLKKALVPVKEQLQKAADAAVELAKTGLGKIAAALASIPSKVQEVLTSACQSLPGGEDLQGTCSSSMTTVVTKATETLGAICTAGVKKIEEEATKACNKASTTADNLLKSADTACNSAAQTLSSIAPTIVPPIQEACTNVTTELKGIVGDLCKSTSTRVLAAANSTCSAIGSPAASPPAAAAAAVANVPTAVLAADADRIHKQTVAGLMQLGLGHRQKLAQQRRQQMQQVKEVKWDASKDKRFNKGMQKFESTLASSLCKSLHETPVECARLKDTASNALNPQKLDAQITPRNDTDKAAAKP